MFIETDFWITKDIKFQHSFFYRNNFIELMLLCMKCIKINLKLSLNTLIISMTKILISTQLMLNLFLKFYDNLLIYMLSTLLWDQVWNNIMKRKFVIIYTFHTIYAFIPFRFKTLRILHFDKILQGEKIPWICIPSLKHTFTCCTYINIAFINSCNVLYNTVWKSIKHTWNVISICPSTVLFSL